MTLTTFSNPRDELEALIASDQGRLGEVFRLTRQGLSPQQIADKLDVATHNFVYNNRRFADAALDGRPVDGPSFRRQTLAVLTRLISRGRLVLSTEAMRLLVANKASVELAAVEEDPVAEASAAEAEDKEAASTLASLEGTAGLYAFSYGWYLESPLDPEHGNTLIKVGHSTNVAARIREHTSRARAHMPEPLVLVRVYAEGEGRTVDLERSFHDLLRAAGHSNPRRVGPEVGTEWFLTNPDFLDTIARVIGLRTLYIGQSEFASG